MDHRRARVAKVHIAKKQLALEDEIYRSIILRLTGKNSTTDCSLAELDTLLGEFKRLGFHDARVRPASQKAYVRMIYAIWADLRPFLKDHSEAALRGFVQRQTKTSSRPDGVAAPEFLGPKDANLVIEGLKAWLHRVQQAGSAQHA